MGRRSLNDREPVGRVKNVLPHPLGTDSMRPLRLELADPVTIGGFFFFL